MIVIKCGCGKICKEPKYKVGDIVYRKGYGIGHCIKTEILKIEIAASAIDFIYFVQATTKPCAPTTVNILCEDDIYTTLEDLKSEWMKEVASPEIIDLTK